MTTTPTDNPDVVDVTPPPVRISVDQMIESLQAEAIELTTRINGRLEEIYQLQQANTQDRARRRVVKRVLTATKPKPRKAAAPVKKAAKA